MLFEWKELEERSQISDRTHAGFLAQEVEEILPDLVTTSAEGIKSMNYIELIPYLVEMNQRLLERIEQQQEHIEHNQERIDQQLGRIEQLEHRVN